MHPVVFHSVDQQRVLGPSSISTFDHSTLCIYQFYQQEMLEIYEYD